MPIIESMAALVTADHCLMQAARKYSNDLINKNSNKDLDSSYEEFESGI